MDKPHIAQKSPYEFEVQAGETYFWCACGLSDDQPFCDDTHEGTKFEPVEFTAEKTETVWLCGCKQTKTPPFCDGTHNGL
jgi:CDGSH-type Zn-finger protein